MARTKYVLRRQPDSLSLCEAGELVHALLMILFYNSEGQWDPDNEWNSDTLAEIGELMDEFQLRPVEEGSEESR